MAEAAGDDVKARLSFLEWLEGYSLSQGIDDPALRRTIKSERWKSRHRALSALMAGTAYRARILKESLKSTVKGLLAPLYLVGAEKPPPVGRVRFGDLRRLMPISRVFGFDRGTPVDRYYIEMFLRRYASDIRGTVLEVGDDTYTRRFGEERVQRSDVLHVSEEGRGATVIADLANAPHIASDSFDCVVLTQTLHLIYDVRAALTTLRRILKPGGVLLATFPGISQIDHYEWRESWYWGFTTLSARRLFEEVFPAANVSIESHGNVLAATAFLQGIALEELGAEELDHRDPDYPVIITARAAKDLEA